MSKLAELLLDPVKDLIFVSIAAYRDPQLAPTLADCLAKAAFPARLRFGICWQHGPEEPEPAFKNDSRCTILDVDWQDARGACWARAEIMKLWRGEQWFLQIDAHSRFAPGWDRRLIFAAIQTGSAKPILSSYPCPFTPAVKIGCKEVLSGAPQKIIMQGFSPDGIPELKPEGIPAPARLKAPIPARFLAAGFLFAPGTFVEEVPYDPQLYFHGEETAMTLRAYTSGYDLFHPAEVLLWHDYERPDAVRHWDDHIPASVATTWKMLDLASKERVHGLFRGEETGEFSLGHVRTLSQYEQFAGISFGLKKIQDYTRLGEDPPNPELQPDWPDRIFTWMVRILFDPARLGPAAFNDQKAWRVAIHDEQKRDIYRRDFPASELAGITGKEPRIALICDLRTGIIPATWSLQPISTSQGWLKPIEGELTDEDYSIIRDE